MSLPQIELKKLGKSVSQFGLGGFHQLEISADIVGEVVDAYLAEGGNYIETARGYGQGASEAKIGEALKGKRDQVTLVSKSGAGTADDIRRDLEASLEALGTDTLDIYFFHGPDAAKLEKITAPGGAVEGLMKARDEGLIGGMGLSSHVPATYLDAMERIDLAVILVWINYLDCLNWPIIPERVIPEAQRRGIGITGMKPLADGLLWKSVEPAVAYAMGSGAEVVVSGTNSPEQVRQMAAAVRKGAADEKTREQILRDAPELGCYVCRRCGQCPASLMDLFRLEGEADRQMLDQLPRDPADYALRQKLSGWFGQAAAAREQFAAMAPDIEVLLAAGANVECPFGIDIPRKVRLAVTKLTEQPVYAI